MLFRWLNLERVDHADWIDAAFALPEGIWTGGGLRLGKEHHRPSFRRRGGLIDARVERDGIGFGMIATSITAVVAAHWPTTVVAALAGRQLSEIVETPMTSGISASIVSATGFAGTAGMVMILASASIVRLHPSPRAAH